MIQTINKNENKSVFAPIEAGDDFEVKGEIIGKWLLCDGTAAGLNKAVGGNCVVQFSWGAPVAIRICGQKFALPAKAIECLAKGERFEFRLNSDATITWQELASRSPRAIFDVLLAAELGGISIPQSVQDWWREEKD